MVIKWEVVMNKKSTGAIKLGQNDVNELFKLIALLNKARNSHKPRLGEYVQQGNVKNIYYQGGGSFSSFIPSIVSKKLLKKLVFKYSGSKGVEKNYFISS